MMELRDAQPEEAGVALASGGGSDAAASAAVAVWQAIRATLGNSSMHRPTGLPARNIGGFLFPAIPAGVPTVIIPIAFPLTTPGPSAPTKAAEEAEVLAVFLLAGVIWALPWLFSNSRFCCRCFRRCLSRRLGCYFCVGLLANLTLISCVIASVPDVSANDVFFAVVHIIAAVTDKLQEVLIQLSVLLGACLLYSFRRKIVSLLGYDSQLIRADLRDCLTCFSMQRFSTIEVSFLKATNLPVGFGSRTLFLRLVLGCNEPLHSRPHDGCTASMNIRERLQLNYDPEDTTQRLSIMVKHQEIVGGAVAQLTPAAGALMGAAAGLMTPAGPQAGAAVGALAGIGTANSLGPEVARVDMSSSMINRIRKAARLQPTQDRHRSTSIRPSFAWREEHFVKVDLVPQGSLWLRIADVPS